MIQDNLSRHTSRATGQWLEAHPRFHPVFIPVGACWLNLPEGGWRLFRRVALAGQDFCDAEALTYASQVATAHLNQQANPWRWNRPKPPTRTYRRCFVYRL